MKNTIITLLAILVGGLAYLLVKRQADPVGSVPEAARPSVIDELLDEMFAAPEFSAAALGFCLIDDAGEVVIDRQASVSFIPASTLKTVTATTALEVLGPEFRFETPLLSDAAIADSGELVGDLVIRGSGDPTLHTSDLAKWVVELQKAGLLKIGGGVVGDATFFPEEIAGEYWNWGDVGNGYGSPAGGLNLNHNRFAAVLRPGAGIGAKADLIRVTPEVPGVEWINRVVTGRAGSGDNVMIYGGPNATRLVLRGRVPLGNENIVVMGAVPDPAMFAAHEFDRQLRDAGVVIGKAPSVVPFDEEPAEGRSMIQLLSHTSAPLAEIVQHLNEVSDNHESECLYRLLGVRADRPADEVIRDHWRARGLDLSDFRMVDGSGLSRANFITAVDLTRLQHLARRGSQGRVYYESLNGYYDGKVRWKGGAMSSVRSYTGYVTGESGREYTFSLMFNHYLDGAAVSAWRDRIVEALLKL